jgi:hypothetical protein
MSCCANMLLWIIATVPPPGRRGRKRSLSNLLQSSFAPGSAGQPGAGAGGPLSGISTPHAARQSLLRRTSSGGSALWSNVPPGAAVYENSIGGRTNALGGELSLFLCTGYCGVRVLFGTVSFLASVARR